MWLVPYCPPLGPANGLSETLRLVLLALGRPDPGPVPEQCDTPVRAIARRVPELTRQEVGIAVRALELGGWLDIPFIKGLVTPREAARPASWLTTKGRQALDLLHEEIP